MLEAQQLEEDQKQKQQQVQQQRNSKPKGFGPFGIIAGCTITIGEESFDAKWKQSDGTWVVMPRAETECNEEQKSQ